VGSRVLLLDEPPLPSRHGGEKIGKLVGEVARHGSRPAGQPQHAQSTNFVTVSWCYCEAIWWPTCVGETSVEDIVMWITGAPWCESEKTSRPGEAVIWEQGPKAGGGSDERLRSRTESRVVSATTASPDLTQSRDCRRLRNADWYQVPIDPSASRSS